MNVWDVYELELRRAADARSDRKNHVIRYRIEALADRRRDRRDEGGRAALRARADSRPACW